MGTAYPYRTAYLRRGRANLCVPLPPHSRCMTSTLHHPPQSGYKVGAGPEAMLHKHVHTALKGNVGAV
jgi:hypothetical protein